MCIVDIGMGTAQLAIYTKDETMSNDSNTSDDDCLYHFRKMHRKQRNENDASQRKDKIGEEVPRLASLLT